MIQPGEKIPKKILSPSMGAPTLVGKMIKIVPYKAENHLQPLFEVTNGSPIRIGNNEYPAYDAFKLIWRYLRWGPFKSAEELGAYLSEIETHDNTVIGAVLDKATEHVVGVASFCKMNPSDRKVEARFGVISPIAQSFGLNHEMAFMLFEHFFSLGYRRIDGWVNVNNTRSLMAQLRTGWVYEGIVRSSVIARGRNMDIAIFRMLDYEWPEVREKLIKKTQARSKKHPKL